MLTVCSTRIESWLSAIERALYWNHCHGHYNCGRGMGAMWFHCSTDLLSPGGNSSLLTSHIAASLSLSLSLSLPFSATHQLPIGNWTDGGDGQRTMRWPTMKARRPSVVSCCVNDRLQGWGAATTAASRGRGENGERTIERFITAEKLTLQTR